MPLLAGFLLTGFTGLVAWLSAFVTKKIAVAAALALFFVTGWLAFEATLKALFTALSYTLPTWTLGPLAVVSYLLPDNFDACVAACMAAVVARWVWDAQREWAKAVASV